MAETKQPIPAPHSDWLEVCGGGVDPKLAESLHAIAMRGAAKQGFTANDLENIQRLKHSISFGDELPSEAILEKLRRVCQLWEVDFASGSITSHRPILGPFIVAGKKLLLPLIRVLLKQTLQKQRDFNASVIELLVAMLKEDHSQGASPAARKL